jgi:hypothetical protein
MSTSPFEIIAGPATVYVAPVGEAFPAVNAAPAGNWVSLGDTEGGVTITHDQTVELLRVDQYPGPQKAIRSEEGLMVAFSLANLTLEQYARALNVVTVTTNVGPPHEREIPLRQGFDVNQRAMLIRGPSPYMDANLQYEVPIVVQTASPSPVFVRDDKAVLDCEWVALEDPNAATAEERFGVLRAQDA